ncbi:hypothetical protein ACF1BS_08145 [Streptomyces sp. NPDC014748]|uniref:hypothetical protein n=1 Tax=Streptomyces sp. NPDC014748 TaxID=3364905 RepID=UPI003702CF80
MIHETGDVEGAERYWSDLLEADASQVLRTTLNKLLRTTLKKHNPKTTRRNVGEDYRGCRVIGVLQSAEPYRRIEGWWYGIVGAAAPVTDSGNRT